MGLQRLPRLQDLADTRQMSGANQDDAPTRDATGQYIPTTAAGGLTPSGHDARDHTGLTGIPADLADLANRPHSDLTGIGADDHRHVEAKNTPGTQTTESVTWTTAFAATPVIATSFVYSNYASTNFVAVLSVSTTGASLRCDTGGAGTKSKHAIAMEAT